MKKLMFAAAVAAASVAMADVTSANIVGYQGNTLREGRIALGSSFIPVSGETIDLTDVVIISEDETEEDVDIQKLTARGGAVSGSNFYWNNFMDDEDLIYGWFNGSGKKAVKGDQTYEIGDAIWINAPDNTFKIQYSGAVDQEGSAVVLREGRKLIANPTPVAVNLYDVKVTSEDETEEDVDIQKLTARGGAVSGSNFYWNNFMDGEDLVYGWYNGSGKRLTREDGMMYGPGEAMWVNAPDNTFQIEWPGVTIAK